MGVWPKRIFYESEITLVSKLNPRFAVKILNSFFIIKCQAYKMFWNVSLIWKMYDFIYIIFSTISLKEWDFCSRILRFELLLTSLLFLKVYIWLHFSLDWFVSYLFLFRENFSHFLLLFPFCGKNIYAIVF